MADSVTITGDKATAAALEAAEKLIVAGVERAGRKWLLKRIPQLARYPAARPSSSYRRTGDLGRKWTSAQPQWQSNGSAFVGKLGNATPYGPFVQGDPGKRPGQAQVHQGRWGVASKIGQEAEPELETDIKAEIERVAAEVNRVSS